MGLIISTHGILHWMILFSNAYLLWNVRGFLFQVSAVFMPFPSIADAHCPVPRAIPEVVYPARVRRVLVRLLYLRLWSPDGYPLRQILPHRRTVSRSTTQPDTTWLKQVCGHQERTQVPINHARRKQVREDLDLHGVPFSPSSYLLPPHDPRDHRQG